MLLIVACFLFTFTVVSVKVNKQAYILPGLGDQRGWRQMEIKYMCIKKKNVVKALSWNQFLFPSPHTWRFSLKHFSNSNSQMMSSCWHLRSALVFVFFSYSCLDLLLQLSASLSLQQCFDYVSISIDAMLSQSFRVFSGILYFPMHFIHMYYYIQARFLLIFYISLLLFPVVSKLG